MNKKIVSLILALSLASSFALGIVFVDKSVNGAEASIAIMSDLHIVADSYFTEQNISYYANRDKMEHLSEAITKTIIDDLVGNKRIKTVLIPGDLTEDGDIISHKAAAKIFKRLTDAGKKVFVINGNHDSPSNLSQIPELASAEEFREIYGEFGYNKALTKDDKSLSYVADINDKFRIIAIDNDNYYSTDINGYKDEMDERLIEWVKTQLRKAVADGKTPLAMAHKPLVGHMPAVFDALVGEKMISPIFSELATALADNGCKYIFTGHMHGQDIAYHTTESQNKIVDIETSSAVYLPVAYRILYFKKNKVEITSKTVQKLNMNYVSTLNSAEDYASIRDGFRTYAKEHLIRGNSDKILSRISSTSLSFLQGLPENISQFVELLIDDIGATIMRMPLYGNGDELSLEQIVTQNGGTLTPSNYQNLLDIVAEFIIIVNSGDENIAIDAVELELLKKCVFALFYFLNDRQGELQELFPASPIINIDLERLFTDGELEAIESNLIAFVYDIAKDMLPIQLRNLNIQDLALIKIFIPVLINGVAKGMGEKVNSFVGSKDIMLDNLIDEVLFGYYLKDALVDDTPDNNVVIDRTTLLPI